jgi:hypothetical protein
VYGRFQRGSRAVSSHFLTSALNVSTGHSAQRRGEEFLEVLHRKLRDRLAVARHYRLEWLDVRELGLCLDYRRHALEAVHHLRIHRMLDPQRAVLVERGDTLGRRHELRTSLGRRGLHEFDDRFLGRAVAPRGKRVGLRLGRCPYGKQRQQCQRTEEGRNRVFSLRHELH